MVDVTANSTTATPSLPSPVRLSPQGPVQAPSMQANHPQAARRPAPASSWLSARFLPPLARIGGPRAPRQVSRAQPASDADQGGSVIELAAQVGPESTSP